MIDKARLQDIQALLDTEVAEGRLLGAAVQVAHQRMPLDPVVAGSRRLEDSQQLVEADTIFLVASITKPIVCAAIVKLLEEGRVTLDDPVAHYVPEFAANGKQDVLIRNLLTHTSGLPDQIPENLAYRKARKHLGEFIDRICELPLGFNPGTRISYQSTGIAMLGAITERVTGEPLSTHLEKQIFEPLGLEDTTLRMLDRSDRESDVRIAGEGLTHGGSGTDFDWNSDYWRGFGAPWGGMLTTVEEMTRLLLLFRNHGEVEGVRILSEPAVKAMIQDQVCVLHDLPDAERRKQRWGLGWRLSGPGAGVFGDLVADDTFGHGGATGTLAWVDPVSDTTCVIFTNDPQAASRLRSRISNLVAASVR